MYGVQCAHMAYNVEFINLFLDLKIQKLMIDIPLFFGVAREIVIYDST